MKAWAIYYVGLLKRMVGIAPSPGALMGKRVIVGITMLDKAGALIEQFQVQGRVSDFSLRDGLVLTKPDGGRYTLPPTLAWLKPARPGEYRLRSTGDVVIDPDYLQSSTLSGSSAERVQELKTIGFTGPFLA